MLKKGSKLYSILTGTCPKCQGEKMFTNPNPFSISENLKMHDHCSKCGLKYQIEPSFFFGAMYVSYALGVALAVAIFVICYWSGLGLLDSFYWIAGLELLLMPIVTRVSRNIYINMFVHYDKHAIENYSKSAVNS